MGYEFGDFKIDTERKVVFFKGEEKRSPDGKPLWPKAVDILIRFVEKRPNTVHGVDVEDLLDQQSDDRSRVLTKYTSLLRRSLGNEFDDYVKTVPKKRDSGKQGVGYKFVGEVKHTPSAMLLPPTRESERRLFDPDPLAERRVSLSGRDDCRVIGSAVETLVHSTLDTSPHLSEMGWDPERVVIKDTTEMVDSAPILKRLGSGLLALAPNEANDIKFVLTSAPPPLKDDEDNIRLLFGRTDFQTHNTVRTAPDGVEKNESLALEFGNLDVELNRVPSSVGLHFIVRLADDSVLLIKRRNDLAHEKGAWSISGEEQFKTHDFWDKSLLRVFQRALCEEIVGLYDKAPETLETRWREHVVGKVELMKLWGLLFEEHACVTSLLGFYQLRLSRRDFLLWRRELAKRFVGRIDTEGKIYWSTTAELERLFKTGEFNAWDLWTAESVTVSAKMLHKTSRYRAFRLFRAVHGRCPGV